MQTGTLHSFIILIFFFLSSLFTIPGPVANNQETEPAVTPPLPKLSKPAAVQQKPVACADCDYIIDLRQHRVDNAELKLPPGSTIGIKGQNRNSIYIKNFHGTAEKPFLFINCDGKTTITSGSVGIKIHESSFVRLTGTGSADKYGIKITTAVHGVQAEHGTTNFEIDHIEISDSKSIGFLARSNPTQSTNRENFVQRNTVIHDNFIHDVGNEGLYVGGSHWQDPSKKEPELIGVRVYNNRVENVGYDGIQVGSAIKDSEIFNNIIINYGTKNVTYHQSGLQINPGTTGKIHSNYIRGGTGNAIFLTGFGNDVYNNLILDCAKNAFYVADRKPLPNYSYRLVNNTMVNVKGYAVAINSDLSHHNIFYNNVMVNTAKRIDNMGSSQISFKNNFESHSKENIFIDPDNLNFAPLPDSPLVDTGLDVNISTDLNIKGDYLLNNRKSGKSIDIGAFEFQK